MLAPARPLLLLALLMTPGALPGALPDALPGETPPGDGLDRFAAAIGPAAARQALFGLVARADADGPRGAFVNEVVSLADGTVRFRQTKQGATTDLLISEGRVFERPGGAASPFAPADAALAGFVRGHEVHRMLLDPERRFRPEARAVSEGCVALRGPDDLPVTICRAADSALPATIELGLPADLGGGSTTIELGEWRSLHGVRLPFALAFLHAGERHTYRYAAVLPFRLAPGAPLPDAPDALFARLGDLAALAAAHERVLEAHRRSDVHLLLSGAPERSLDSGRGRLHETGRDELAARLGPYLAGIRFARYEDVAIPVVAVSADGTLGWLACEIEAAGTSVPRAGETPEAIAYGFSWVELSARQGGDWQTIGNASSARP